MSPNCLQYGIKLSQGSDGVGSTGQAWKIVLVEVDVLVVVVIVVVVIVVVLVSTLGMLPQYPLNGFKIPKFQVNPANSNVGI